MLKEPKVLLEVKVHKAADWTPEQCDTLCAWLREKAKDIERERKVFASTVRMRYYGSSER